MGFYEGIEEKKKEKIFQAGDFIPTPKYSFPFVFLYNFYEFFDYFFYVYECNELISFVRELKLMPLT